MTKEWKEKLTPESSEDPRVKKALEWWHGLPIQNLQDMNDSWVGYLWKYYPDKTHPYHLTSEEVQHIYESEHVV